MRRPLRTVTIVVLTAGLAGAALWLGLRPSVGDPPRLDRPETVDPQVAERITALTAEVDARPRDAERRARLAMAFHANHLFEPAERAYHQALALDGRNPRLWYQLARVGAQQRTLEDAVASIDRAIELEPTYAPAHWQRGFWLLTLGDVDGARAAFERSAAEDPTALAAPVGLARVDLQENRFAAAAERLEPLVRAHPEVAYMHQLLGTALGRLGRDEEARRELARASGRPPRWRDPWADEVAALDTGYESIISRAQDLIVAGETSRALDLLQALCKTRPDDPVALNTLGSVYLARNQVDEAIDVLETCLHRSPDHHPTHLNLSVALGRTGALDRALHHAEEAVTINPGFGPAHLHKGRILLARKEPEAAAAALRDAVRCGVDDPEARPMLASVLEQLERWPEARATYAEIVVRQPARVDALLGLARTTAASGEIDEAWNLVRRARTLDPPDQDLRRTIVRLQELEAGAGPS